MLYETFHKSRKIIEFGLLSSCLNSMNRVGKDNKQTRLRKLSITPLIIFFKMMLSVTNINFTFFD